MQDFRDLKVWHKAHATTLAVYRSHKGLSPRRGLRPNQPDTTIRGFSLGQYRRRLRQG